MVATNQFVSAPLSLLCSNLSHGAIHTYLLLSILPTNEGRIWVSQGYLGNQLNCSTRHVRNFLKELETSGFLLNTGDWHGQNRVYRLLTGPTGNDLGSGQGETAEVATFVDSLLYRNNQNKLYILIFLRMTDDSFTGV